MIAMKKHITIKLALLVLSTQITLLVYAQHEVAIVQQQQRVSIKNDKVQLNFDLQTGRFFLANAGNEKIIDNAYFQAGGLQSKDSCEKRIWTEGNITDSIGKGKSLTIKIAFKNYADILWQVRLYDDKPFFIFNMGIDNDASTAYQLMSFSPLVSRDVYKG